jgi:hypothetical protein
VPLPMQIAERPSERSLRRCDRALLVDPRAQVVEHRPGALDAAGASLVGGIARQCRLAFDGEQRRDLAHTFQRQDVTRTRCLVETSSRVALTAGALAAGTPDERRHAGDVALHGASEIVAEEASDVVGVGARRVEEARRAFVQHHMPPVRMSSVTPGPKTVNNVESVPSSPGPGVFWWIRLATGMSRSTALATLLPSVCGAMSMPARGKRMDCRSTGLCSTYLSQRASTMSVSPSFPRSTIAGGVGADTIASSCGHATRSSRRSMTMTLAGATSKISHVQ